MLLRPSRHTTGEVECVDCGVGCGVDAVTGTTDGSITDDGAAVVTEYGSTLE